MRAEMKHVCYLYHNPSLKVKKTQPESMSLLINYASQDVLKIEFCEIMLIKYTCSIIYIVVIVLW